MSIRPLLRFLVRIRMPRSAPNVKITVTSSLSLQVDLKVKYINSKISTVSSGGISLHQIRGISADLRPREEIWVVRFRRPLCMSKENLHQTILTVSNIRTKLKGRHFREIMTILAIRVISIRTITDLIVKIARLLSLSFQPSRLKSWDASV